VKLSLFQKMQYTWKLSRIGYILFGSGILLGVISFAKGIHILMFIPALVVSLLLYARQEIYSVKKHFHARLVETSEWQYLLQIDAKRIDAFRFRILLRNGEKTTLLDTDLRHKRIQFPKHTEKAEVELLVTGIFDIFRTKISLGSISGRKEDSLTTLPKNSNPLFAYIHFKSYDRGDNLWHLDGKRSSISSIPILRIHEHTSEQSDRERQPTLQDGIDFETNTPLDMRDISKASFPYYLLLVLINTAIIWIQWEDSTMNTYLIATHCIVAIGLLFLKRTKKEMPNFLKHGTILLAFAGMIFWAIAQEDLSLPGAVFLTQILSLKFLFPDEREDGFLYLFLSLFVFVAVSLFTLELWFILFLFVYLAILVQLLPSVSGYSFTEPPSKYIRSYPKKWKYPKVLVSIFCLMGIFFFLLPHWEKIADNSELTLGNKSAAKTISGFWGEIDLSIVAAIREDTSKKIVVEQASNDMIRTLQTTYWRGERFVHLENLKWQKNTNGNRKTFIETFDGSKLSETKEWGNKKWSQITSNDAWVKEALWITYYSLSNSALPLPAIPAKFNIDPDKKIINGYQYQNDNSLFWIFGGTNETVSITLEASSNSRGNIEEAPAFFSGSIKPLDPKMVAIFEPFLKSIDPEISKSPWKLSAYIRDRAGFQYSIDNPAPTLQSFLYESKQGHCEYFATTLAFALQYNGHRATVVNGYLGGSWNPLAEAWVIQGKHAHSWVEVYDKEWEKWNRYDPTPAIISPQNTFQTPKFKNWFSQLYDYIDLRWYNTIVNFNRDAQKDFLLAIWRNIGIIWFIGFFYFVWNYSSILRTWFVNYWNETEEERLEKYLKKSIWTSFPLEIYQDSHPLLVTKTRRFLYGKKWKEGGNKEYSELMNEWKNIIKPSH
jgi:TgpA N-terminal domain/Transglutaminase-like superfamily